MRSIEYSVTGGPEVLTLVEGPVRDPGPGEVRVRMHRSGVNPTDWKSRRGAREGVAVRCHKSPTRTAPGWSTPSVRALRQRWWAFGYGFGRPPTCVLPAAPH